MKVNITRRDFKFFILGIAAMIIFVIIYDWKDFERGFTDGYNGNNYQVEKTE